MLQWIFKTTPGTATPAEDEALATRDEPRRRAQHGHGIYEADTLDGRPLRFAFLSFVTGH